MKKIASGSQAYPNMKDYVKEVFRRFETNRDGMISSKELGEGLRKMGIQLKNKELNALMSKIDLNSDGEVSEEELYKVLKGVERSSFPKSYLNETAE